MANRDKNGKALGQNPFADLDEFDFEAIDAAAAKPAPDWLKAAQAGDKKPAPPPKAKKKPLADPQPVDPALNVEVEVTPPDSPEGGEKAKTSSAGEPQQSSSDPSFGGNGDSTPIQPPPARGRGESLLPNGGLAQKQRGDEANGDATPTQPSLTRERSEVLPPSGGLGGAEPADDPPVVQVETPAAIEPTDVPDMVAEPDEETTHLLDDLIATIDDEIERTFTGEMTTAFASQRRAQQAANQAQYVIFRLAGTEYAAPALTIKEVGEVTNLTPVPNVPPWLTGVTNLRGDIVSVVDLRLFLGIEQTEYAGAVWQDDVLIGTEQEMLIAQANDPTGLMVSLMVDVVSDIRYLNLDNIERPKAPIEDKIAPYLQGIYEDEEEDEFLVILDFEKLLLSPDMKQFEPV